jgi:hypothetical protein
MHRLAQLLVAALVLGGCEPAAPPLAVAPPQAASEAAAETPATQLRAEGDALMAAGDHRGASDRYRRAAALEPDDVSLRFALGTAYTFLGRRPEAIGEFRWVVKHADRESAEYREARRWLIGAGLPVDTAAVTTAPAAGPRPPAEAAPDNQIVGGRLIGSTEWPGIDPKVRAVSGEISIAGIEASTEKVTRSRPLRLGGRYHFYDIPPGQYRLVARMASSPRDVTVWDQKVVVGDGTVTELALTPATAHVSPDKFPPPVH